MRLTEAQHNVVDDVKAQVKNADFLPLSQQQQVGNFMDLRPVLDYVLRVVLKDALQQLCMPL